MDPDFRANDAVVCFKTNIDLDFAAIKLKLVAFEMCTVKKKK